MSSVLWVIAAYLCLAVALLFFERTRRVGVGMLLGFGCLLILGAGACTVLIFAAVG